MLEGASPVGAPASVAALILRSGEASFEYEREVQPRPKLGRWTSELGAPLAGNVVKSARKQLTLIRIFEELRGRRPN